MKKIFMVAGELSGDKLGAWFLREHMHYENFIIEAVGGSFMEAAGAHLWERFEKLNVTGIIEIIKHLPSLLSFLNRVALYIVEQDFDEVVLIDFPGFNLRLAKKLKKLKPTLKITYLSPPQMWIWGAWRVTSIQRFIHRVIVLYPFEVGWYQERGVCAEWLGNPVYDRLQPYFGNKDHHTQAIAVIPGSRNHEISTLFPIAAQVISLFLTKYPKVMIVLPLAESITQETIETKLCAFKLDGFMDRIQIVTGEHAKNEAVSRCCLAITKPGTITLELALLGVPAVMFFKTSRINYMLGKMVVKVDHIALPNLLLKKSLYKEFVQDECDPRVIFDEADTLYQAFLTLQDSYFMAQKNLLQTRDILKRKC